MRSIGKHIGISTEVTNALIGRVFTPDRSIVGITVAKETCTAIFTRIIQTLVTTTPTGATKADDVASTHKE